MQLEVRASKPLLRHASYQWIRHWHTPSGFLSRLTKTCMLRFDWQEDGCCPELSARHFRAWSTRVSPPHSSARVPARARSALSQGLITFAPARVVRPSGLQKLRTWVKDPTLGAMRHFEEVNGEHTCIRQLSRAERFLEHHQGWRDLCDGLGRMCSRLFGAPASLFKSGFRSA